MKSVDKSYFDIYSNSKSCQLLILTKMKGKKKLLIGRALVWNPSEMELKGDVKFKGAEYFMDRIYCMRDSDERKFLNYADEQGWLVKSHNNSDDYKGMILKLGNDIIKLKIVCKVKGDCDEYPYMDTLKYLSKEKDEISNIGFKKGYVLKSTDGEYRKCDFCEGKGSEECNYCNGGKISCQTCNGYGKVGSDKGKLKDCKDCKEKGKVDCPECNGTGYSGLCDECTGLINKL